MATNYYFTDGNINYRRTIYVPNGENEYMKDKQDIAYFDKNTIELGKDIKPRLEECNPGLKLTDNRNYFIVRNPQTEKILPIYYPVLSLKNYLPYSDLLLLEQFRDLSIERIKLFETTGQVSNINGLKMEAFYDTLIGKIYHLDKDTMNKIFNKTSIVGKDAKLYFTTNGYKMKQVLLNYSQLRNLLIMYLSTRYKDRPSPSIYDLMSVNKNYDEIDGLYHEDPAEIKTLLMNYKEELLKAKSEEEIRDLQDSVVNHGKQLTLGDFIQGYNEFAKNDKKR